MATYGLKSFTIDGNTYEMNTKNGISINGTSWDGSASGTAIYAPTTAGTNGYFLQSNGSGAPTWAQVPAGVTVTLNGSTTTTPSFYAPTAAGTSGQVLISSGSGAPTWGTATAGAQNLVDGSSTGSLRGVGTTAESSSYTIGQYAFVEGRYTKASGNYSHAEGWSTISSGVSSHAEGEGDQDNDLVASGRAAHAEGQITIASGDASHAEGYYSIASGSYSHAGNYCTTAQRKSQTVIGEFNILDTTGTTTTKGDYAFIIGNGTASNARSNALTVSWTGEADIQNGLEVAGVDHTITTAEYNDLIDALDAI